MQDNVFRCFAKYLQFDMQCSGEIRPQNFLCGLKVNVNLQWIGCFPLKAIPYYLTCREWVHTSI